MIDKAELTQVNDALVETSTPAITLTSPSTAVPI